MGSLHDLEVACLALDRQGSNFESCVMRAGSSHLSPNPQEVVMAQFSLYVHKGGLKPHSFHFISLSGNLVNRFVHIDTFLQCIEFQMTITFEKQHLCKYFYLS